MKNTFLVLSFCALVLGQIFNYFLGYTYIPKILFFAALILFFIHFIRAAKYIIKGNKSMAKEFFVNKKTFAKSLDISLKVAEESNDKVTSEKEFKNVPK
jgi:hypothetical protein